MKIDPIYGTPTQVGSSAKRKLCKTRVKQPCQRK